MKQIPVNRRQFLRAATVTALTTPMTLPPNLSADHHGESVGQNWAKTFSYGAARFHRPANVNELREIVRRSNRVKALGGRHSFSRIADTDADLIATSQFNQIIKLDAAKRTVTVGGGMKYGELAHPLHDAGFAVHNLASLPHIQVAGAIGTATHGSGDGNGNLASPVSALKFVTADGDILQLGRGDRDFEGAVVHLGALGVITEVSLDIEPAFNVQQHVYRGLTQDQLKANFEEIFSLAYSVSVFTDWQEDPRLSTIWVKRRDDGRQYDAPAERFGAKLADRHVHPIIGLDAEVCTPQMGESGPWYNRLPHFLMDFTPSAGEELQSEFFVPREKAVDAIGALYGLHRELKHVLQISEIRSIKGDDYWMSTAGGGNRVALHFTWVKDWSRVVAVLPVIEETLAPFDARPHWGKVTTMRPKVLQSRYPKLAAFRQLASRLDPDGKFRNDYLNKYIWE